MRIRAVAAAAAVCLSCAQAHAEIAVIPRPQSVVADAGPGVRFDAGTAVIVQDPAAANAARWLQQAAHERLALTWARSPHRAAVAVRLVRSALVGDEAYRLTINARGATIAARTRAGWMHGAATLVQILAPAPHQPIPAATIDDAPRYAWRGLMLDSARHMQSVDAIKRLLDLMALHKLNTLQWHLTDDQGWRLPVARYPRLTAIGGWRTEPDGSRYGGSYTRAQIRAVVAYASARAITVVPEIEMPGHMLAALRAYPRWGFTAGVPAGAEADWGIFPSVLGVDPPALRAMKTVLDETMRLFPGRMIATGGDEAVHRAWHDTAPVQAQMHRLGLTSEAGLQGWFAGQIARYLAAQGRQAIGWDDLLAAGGIAPQAAVLSWHAGDGARAALAGGHDVVLATDPVFYFDHRQADDPDEPAGRGSVISLNDVYGVEPGQALPGPGHLLGVQGEVWTEYVRSDAQMLAMAWPRAAALAEVGWTSADRRDRADFAARLPLEARLLAAWGISTTPGAFGPPPQRAGAVLVSQQLTPCANRIALNLPTAGPRPVLVDIMDRCWLTPPIATDSARLAITIAALPFNYQLGEDIRGLALHDPRGPHDELVVHQDSCAGPELARVDLGSVPRDARPAPLHIDLAGAGAGAHRLCIYAASHRPAPLWALDSVAVP